MTTDRPVIREVITKAVCGTGTYKYQRSIDLEVPASQKDIQVLGHFVSNSAIDEAVVVDRSRQGKCVQVKGHYAVHVWYAYDQETRAVKTTVTFIEYIPIKLYGGESIADPAAVVQIIQKPRCIKAHVIKLEEKSIVRVEIEQTLSTEVIGLTTLKIGVVPASVAEVKTVTGRELVPPRKHTPQFVIPEPNCCFDLKCEEDLPEEDEDDYGYDYFRR